MEWLEANNLQGLAIGICTFIIIGLYHPVVIKSEYHFGTRCWWCFLLLGIAGIALSLILRQVLWSALAGVLAFSSFWGIGELFHQKKRVEKGWFPRNPKREKQERDTL